MRFEVKLMITVFFVKTKYSPDHTKTKIYQANELLKVITKTELLIKETKFNLGILS